MVSLCIGNKTPTSLPWLMCSAWSGFCLLLRVFYYFPITCTTVSGFLSVPQTPNSFLLQGLFATAFSSAKAAFPESNMTEWLGGRKRNWMYAPWEEEASFPNSLYPLSSLVNELKLFYSQCPKERRDGAKLWEVFGKKVGSPCSHPVSLPIFRLDYSHLEKERQKSKEKHPPSWLQLWDSSKTQRERIMRSCCRLKTGPQTALYVREVAESAGLREEAAIHEKSLWWDLGVGSHCTRSHSVTFVHCNMDKILGVGSGIGRWHEAGSPGLWEHFVSASIQWHHIGSLRLALVGVFVAWKIANARNQYFFFFFSLNILVYQYTTGTNQ